MEVRNLLSWVMLDTSGHRSKNSTLRRPNPLVILMPPPHKPKELLHLVDTSSQASTKMAEASLEGIPTSISPIAVTSRSRSITPLADATELCENANKALEELLTTKASIDTHRQRAIWELGMELHQNESQVTESIKEAKVVCSQVTLDAPPLCFATVKEAKAICFQVTLDNKAICLAMVKEAKTTQAHTIQEAETACSTAIRDAEIWRTSQAELLQREHGKIMWDLEVQVIWEESRSQANFLSTCQAALYASPTELKSTLLASYHILLGQTPPSHQFVLLQRASLVEEQPTSDASPAPVPKQSPRPKRWHPSPDPVESMPLGRNTSKKTLEGPPSSKQWEIPPWNKVLKLSHTEALGGDSDLVKEARKEFFSKHSYNFITEGSHNLSEIFWQMATSAKLLDTSIYEIQASWMGLNELRQANYVLRSLPKGLKFLHVVPPSESPKVMGLVRMHDPDALHHFSSITHYPCVGRMAGMRGQWSTTCRQYTTGWAWCATNAMIAHQQCLTLSTTTASRTVSNQGRKTLMNLFHQSNYEMRQNCLNWGSKQRGQDGIVSIRLPCQGYPFPPMQPWRRTSG